MNLYEGNYRITAKSQALTIEVFEKPPALPLSVSQAQRIHQTIPSLSSIADLIF